jgi:hypothetical protein
LISVGDGMSTPLAYEILGSNHLSLLSHIENERKYRKADFALVRFREDLQRLDWRYQDYREANRNYKRTQRNRRRAKDLDHCQKKLVNKSMAFHQQAYVVIASLGSLLNQLKDEKASQFPWQEVTDLLDVLESRHFKDNEGRLDDLYVVRNAAWYRSKYVDHPQQHQPHCWLTHYELEDDQEYIIFYNPIPGEEFEMLPIPEASMNPKSELYRLPLGVEQWFTAPDVMATHEAIQRIVLHILSLHPGA